MNEHYHLGLPKPFGRSLEPDEWLHAFERMRKSRPELNLYDGEHDFDTRLLEHHSRPKLPHLLVVDDIIPKVSEKWVSERKEVLVRGHYFAAGLHHRVSFLTTVIDRQVAEGIPVMLLELILPVRSVASLYVSYRQDDRPIYLEIPVSGAPPQVRVLEMELSRLKAFPHNVQRVFPSAKEVDGVKVQIVDLDSLLEEESRRLYGRSATPSESKRKTRRSRSEAPAKDTKPAKPARPPLKSAMIALEEMSLRAAYFQVLKDLGYRCETFMGFEDIPTDRLNDFDLLVLDSRQGELHAVDLLQTWIQQEILLPVRFVIVGKSERDARVKEWEGLGSGRFFRSDSPIALQKQSLDQWLKQKLPLDELRRKTGSLFLLVEYDNDMIEKWFRIAEQGGDRLIITNDAYEAARLARILQPGLIAMNVNVAGLEDLQVLHTLKAFKTTREIPVILFSSQPDRRRQMEARSLGIKHFLIKPLAVEDLQALLLELLPVT